MAQNKNQKNNTNTQNEIQDVLYQNLAGKWYAFSVVEDDLYFAEVDMETIHHEKPMDFSGHE